MNNSTTYYIYDPKKLQQKTSLHPALKSLNASVALV